MTAPGTTGAPVQGGGRKGGTSSDVNERFLARHTVFILCMALTLVGVFLTHLHPWFWMVWVLGACLTLVGVYDKIQTRHSVTRNYPIIGHARFMIESIRPEIRQYLLEADSDKVPFSRAQRSLVYARAKKQLSDAPFGTLLDVYAEGYEFIGHSVRPVPHGDPKDFRITIGGPDCKRPYSASVFNISAMSFGSLSANAIRALNKGAKIGSFAHDTGEGSISPYHREFGGDLIWEIGSGYFGCRDAGGKFDPFRFKNQATDPQVKMIEIKMSQGAKPGHGGILPAAKVSPEIAATRGVPMGEDCISPASHSAFSTPVEMMEFIKQLRDLSDGKPVGFKLALGQPWDFMAMVKAMLETKILPDFIVVDGAEGGTGAAPVEFADHLGVPMREGLLFVHNALVGANLRQHIKLGAAGKVVSAFDIASILAIGADWVNAARGFMFAVGCIQSRSCHTNRCPTGVATQDPITQKSLVVPDKAQRVANFHLNTLKALADMLAAAGLKHPGEIGPHHLARRISVSEIKLFSQLHTFLKPGVLLSGEEVQGVYGTSWKMAQAHTFEARHL
jgi:glutamate synthase domain-containing protein 2